MMPWLQQPGQLHSLPTGNVPPTALSHSPQPEGGFSFRLFRTKPHRKRKDEMSLPTLLLDGVWVFRVVSLSGKQYFNGLLLGHNGVKRDILNRVRANKKGATLSDMRPCFAFRPCFGC